jgi:hypothetical protein
MRDGSATPRRLTGSRAPAEDRRADIPGLAQTIFCAASTRRQRISRVFHIPKPPHSGWRETVAHRPSLTEFRSTKTCDIARSHTCEPR